MTLAMIEVCFMIASLDLLVQLNLHIDGQQSWQASQAVSIGVWGSSRILVVFERLGNLCLRRAIMQETVQISRMHNLQYQPFKPHCTKCRG
jgi:hypothetical protein